MDPHVAVLKRINFSTSTKQMSRHDPSMSRKLLLLTFMLLKHASVKFDGFSRYWGGIALKST